MVVSPTQAIRSLSVFCMVLTIAVFLYVKEYKTMYNRCFICYLSCLTISSLLAFLESIINAPYDFTHKSCLAFGNFTIFFYFDIGY